MAAKTPPRLGEAVEGYGKSDARERPRARRPAPAELRLDTVLERRQKGPLDCSILYPVWNGIRFVRETLPAVLAQEGVRAEILISDDHSTDGTLDAVRELATAYRGPHDVVVLHASRRGEADHLPTLARHARTEVLIQAHHDDVAYPGRARRLLGEFRDGVYLATSFADWRRNGRVFPTPERFRHRVARIRSFRPFLYSSFNLLIGSRMAMHADLFRRFPPLGRAYLTGGIDVLLPIRAAMLGRVAWVSEPLLACGLHPDRWSWRMWDLQSNDTRVFGRALRRVTVFELALAELEQALGSGLVGEDRYRTIRGWLEGARRRFVGLLVRTGEDLVREGWRLQWARADT